MARGTGAYASGTAVRLPVRFLRLNDTVIWAAPVELFCEIAMAVRNQSPFAHTFYFGYTNGWLGYLPTAQAFGEGGYEPRTSPFTTKAEGGCDGRSGRVPARDAALIGYCFSRRARSNRPVTENSPAHPRRY